MKPAGLFVTVMSLTVLSSAQEPINVPPAIRLEPIAAIVDAFRSHPIVAMDEGDHGNEQGHAFRLSLIRDERFVRSVNDIVVEFGSARYQDVMDRFTTGEDVPYSALRQAWENTTQPHGPSDRPIYEEFFRTVRAINASRPRDRQLRVVLGDPPIDWEAVRTGEEWLRWGTQRDKHAIDVIQREVLAKGHRALVIYGGLHFQRKDILNNYEDSVSGIVGALERVGTKIFSIWTNTYADLDALQSDGLTWPTPSLAILRGTRLGAADFALYYPFTPRRVSSQGDDFVPERNKRSLRMEEQFDAVLYVGPPSTITHSQMSRELCVDAPYLKMRLQRISLMAEPIRSQEVDRLRRYCDVPK